MWILPKNYPLSSHFVQDMVESKEDLTLPGLNIESSLMLKSKPSPLRTWFRRWKPDSYLPHLFTRILKPSHRKSFEEKLAFSLEDTHVNLSHQQESDLEKTTPDTYGRISGDTSKQLDLFSASSKMSKDTSRLDSPAVVSDLEEDGYRSAWGIFSAREVGAPHQRKRVYILGNSEHYGLSTSEVRGGASTTSNNTAQGQNEAIKSQRASQPDCGGDLSGANIMANSNNKRFGQSKQANETQSSKRLDSGSVSQRKNVAYKWPPEPRVGRVVDGCADRVDRIRMLGNGVVPQTAAKAYITLRERFA